MAKKSDTRVGRPPKDWVQLNIKLATELHQKVEEEAERRETSKTRVVEDALSKWLGARERHLDDHERTLQGTIQFLERELNEVPKRLRQEMQEKQKRIQQQLRRQLQDARQQVRKLHQARQKLEREQSRKKR